MRLFLIRDSGLFRPYVSPFRVEIPFALLFFLCGPFPAFSPNNSHLSSFCYGSEGTLLGWLGSPSYSDTHNQSIETAPWSSRPFSRALQAPHGNGLFLHAPEDSVNVSSFCIRFSSSHGARLKLLPLIPRPPRQSTSFLFTFFFAFAL